MHGPALVLLAVLLLLCSSLPRGRGTIVQDPRKPRNPREARDVEDAEVKEAAQFILTELQQLSDSGVYESLELGAGRLL